MKEKRGITLIALIITIIVLFILSSVVINSINKGNILKNANEIVKKYNNQVLQEQETINKIFNPSGNIAYTVTYNSNQGTGNMEEQKIKEGTTCVLKTNEYTKKGYAFVKWNTELDGSGKDYNEGESFIPTSNLTLYAIWTEIEYSITYNLDGGTLSNVNQVKYTINTETFILNNPTKSGYEFVGWTGSNGNTCNKTVTITKGSTGDMEYIANWATVTGLVPILTANNSNILHLHRETNPGQPGWQAFDGNSSTYASFRI